ncbi:hypothetical protein BJP34_01755 [Moorena producens PAL-8-15-08-1]|uniref:Magnetosome protein MamS/MamX domain-containing protein n=1 Tax=Moorena producens PAL-8-15-08-1 TaxID=1458985 RepID=A0A1D8TL12_9CYAN|nr:hypothetical protein [Moorena producens]AOW98338.1 hypothetical protein BJP34_01755 [Moorena producens PAL-8-15-08-1]
MNSNLAFKTVTSAAVAGLALLALNASPLRANQSSEASTPASNFVPDWMTPNQSQIYQQQHPLLVQYHGPMMDPGRTGGHGWGHNSHYGRMYDLNTIETISGEVISVDTFTPMGGMSHGVHLQVRTDNETVYVHLGPAWYIDNQEISIERDDKIEVTGSRITFAEQPAIIASEVKKGDATLKLRDKEGIPIWSGWRRGQFN